MKYARVLASLLSAAALLATLAGCAASPTTQQAAAVGAATGATAGALIDSENRWRGGVIGGALGAVFSAGLAEISQRASRQAVQAQKPVAYTNQAGTRRVEVIPAGRRGKCHWVTERYYQDGQLVKQVDRQVCD